MSNAIPNFRRDSVGSPFAKWTARGQLVFGQLLAIEAGAGNYGPRARFSPALFLSPKGDVLRSGEVLVGISSDLEKKITREAIGRVLEIAFVDESEPVAEGYSPTRLFNVSMIAEVDTGEALSYIESRS